MRFHLLNGAVSLLGNLGIVAVLSGRFAIDPVAANAVAIAACSMINFVASEALVFKTYKRLTATTVTAIMGLAVSLGAPSRCNRRRWPGAS